MAAADNLLTAYQNYTRILVLVTQVIAYPSQANIDAVVTTAANLGIVTPKPTVSVDGENYDWTEYQDFIIRNLLPLEQAVQRAQGPYTVVTRGVT